jgi:AAHS family 4-hydroxybenzoate transporter-like MFS transporter
MSSNAGVSNVDAIKCSASTVARVFSLVLLLYIVDGFDLQMLGVTVAALARDWHLPLSSFGGAMAAGHAGAAVGAIVGGIWGDRVGRRPVIIGGVMLFGAASFAIVLASAPWHIVVMRLIAGLGLGGCVPPALALLAEVIPRRRRSLSVSLAMLCTPLGIALAGFCAAKVLPLAGWRAMFVIAGAAPAVLCFAFWIGLPESPGFLRSIPQPQLQPGNRSGLVRQLLQGELGHRTLRLLGMFFFAFLAMSMVLSWMPAMLAHAGYGIQVASTALSAWSLAGMAGVLIAGLVMTRWGTHAAVGIALAGSILALATLATMMLQAHAQLGPVALFGLIAAGGFMLNGTITTIYAHAVAIFPEKTRSSGIGLAATTGRVGAISGAFVGGALVELTSAAGYVATVTAVVAAAALFYAVGLVALRKAQSPQRYS